MKTILLLLFTMHQTFLISNALKCYECSGDCKTPKETDCDAAIKCCYSSAAAIGGGGAEAGATTEATTAAARRMKRNAHSNKAVTKSGIFVADVGPTRRGMFTEFLQEGEDEAAKASTDAPASDHAAGGGGGSESAGGHDGRSADSAKDGEGPEHNYKGCCNEKITKEICTNDALCYLCESDLCNKGNSSASGVLASILSILLPLAIIAVAVSPKKFMI